MAYAFSPIALFGYEVPAFFLVAYAVAAGVLIDLDHFVIARIKTGSWDALRFCLENPRTALVDQDGIFERGDVGVLSRLLSHLVIVGVLAPVLALESTELAVLTAAVLYAHLVSDVVWDISQLRRRNETFVTQVPD
ncbi:hypothetical protein ACFOZ7_20620 [Natribaculum luteum]|uniref:DUF3307 domain-containing protein n=1 Tax=Natribaculum luteum TaxID=1586232 RepID=A0ABD5P4Q9_9EURY|nr:hypothetical protein [Natribaculum luteum]